MSPTRMSRAPGAASARIRSSTRASQFGSAASATSAQVPTSKNTMRNRKLSRDVLIMVPAHTRNGSPFQALPSPGPARSSTKAPGRRNPFRSPMPCYAAFLRAVNVGGRIVKMEDLRRHLAAMGLANVETLIASGNVVFDAPAKSAEPLQARIEAGLKKSLGYEVKTFVRSSEEIAAVAGQ